MIELIGNQIEALLWFLMAGALALRVAIGRAAITKEGVCAAVLLVAFGISDVVESHTGAWWWPWWLLVWKAACLIALTGISVLYFRKRKKSKANH